MKYYKLNIYTDWQVMYSPSYMKKDKDYRNEVQAKINNKELWEDAPIIPCFLTHKHDDYRNIVDWKEEGKEPPSLEPPFLKDVIQRSGMLNIAAGRGIIISKKFKDALNEHLSDEHFFYKFQLEHKDKFHDYYFLIPNRQSRYKHIDFTRTEFLTKPKHKYNASKTKKELIKPSEIVKVENLEEYLKIKNQLKMTTYNNKILYINRGFDFFLLSGNTYFVSERFKDYLEKEDLKVTFSELSPAGKVSIIIAPEDV